MDILIDTAIKYWVFIPILVGLIFFSKLKNNIQAIVAEPPKTRPAVKTESGLKDRQQK
jgi:hypothetical protein